MPTSAVLGRIERTGVLIDSALLAAQSQRARRAHVGARAARPTSWPASRSTSAARSRSARSCSASSACRSSRKTASGAPSTDEDVLQELAADYPLPAQAARAPQPLEAEGHLHRQAAADGEPGDRPRAHHLRAGGGGDRAAVEQRPEPAEHPDPHRRGPARARGLHRARGRVDPVGRLLADRAAHHGAHLRRRRPAARVRRRHRRAPRDRRRGLRRAADPRSVERAAALRQGHQLRPDLRHERVRPGRRTSASSAAPRPPTSSATSRAIPASSATWTRPAPRRSSSGYVETLFGRRVYLPEIRKPGPRAQRRRAAGDQRADAGHRGRPDQAGDDRGAGARSTASSGRRG